MNSWQACLACYQAQFKQPQPAKRKQGVCHHLAQTFCSTAQGKPLKLLLALLLLIASTQASTAKLVMNFFIEPPFVTHGDEDLTGLHIDIFKQLQQQQRNLAIKVQLLPLKRAYLLSAQLPNNCVFGIERTPARETDFVWVSPLYTSRYALYQRPQSDQDLAQLKQLTIGSYLGSGVAEYLESSGYKVDLAKTNLNSAKKLQRKRIQAWASDVLSAAYIFQHYSLNINPKGQPFYSTKRAIACNKNTTLTSLLSLHQGLDQLQQNGIIETILNRYEQQYRVDLDQ
ncbi:substrate-binding periplasmic protein [Agarivorans sp.]|uniref:substrate-binding periplasmic protein n=1 Tax=Agarivorans sp. TaxID=1872412 RepID=UPI003D071AA6